MAQIEYIGEGSLQKFGDIVATLNPKKIFLVTGTGSYTASGAKAYFDAALAGREVLEYSDFHAILTDEDVQKGVAAAIAFAPDLVVGVGGGHVLDAAKAINFYATKNPVVAVPTTAGSGAESTPFAVIYKDGLKQSLEGPDVLPAYVIVDPRLCMSVPRKVALASGLDALAQAIESYWAKGATEESRLYATKAMTLVWGSLERALAGEKEAVATMCLGAHWAGKAIAISKTTACHALSYGLTYRFGVPHGIAVVAFLPSVMRHNTAVLSEGSITAEAIERLLQRLEVPSVASFGVTAADVPVLAAEVNADRLGNNPVPLSMEDIIRMYQSII